MKRIGIVMPLATPRGGAEVLLQHLLRHGGKAFVSHLAFLEPGPLAEEARSLGFEVQVIPITRLSQPVDYIRTIFRLRHWAKEREFHTVLSWMLKAHLYVAPALTGLRARRFWFQHGMPAGIMDKLATRLPAEAVLCCSDFSRLAQDSLPPHRPSVTCYPGVILPEKKFERAAARRMLGLPGSAEIVGMVARLERWKGPHNFIHAATKLAQHHPSLTFFLVGGDHPHDRQYAEEIRAQLASSGLGGRFVLAGHQPPETVPLWLASADIIVHPVTTAEPFGMAVVEAMAAGCCVVASGSGGILEIIEPEISGVLVQPGSVDALVHQCESLLLDSGRRSRIADGATRRAHLFSVDHFIARVQEVLVGT